MSDLKTPHIPIAKINVDPRSTYANVVSTLCLFLLLSGASAFAASD
jgi:hypothetical protein